MLDANLAIDDEGITVRIKPQKYIEKTNRHSILVTGFI